MSRSATTLMNLLRGRAFILAVSTWPTREGVLSGVEMFNGLALAGLRLNGLGKKKSHDLNESKKL